MHVTLLFLFLFTVCGEECININRFCGKFYADAREQAISMTELIQTKTQQYKEARKNAASLSQLLMDYKLYTKQREEILSRLPIVKYYEFVLKTVVEQTENPEFVSPIGILLYPESWSDPSNIFEFCADCGLNCTTDNIMLYIHI